MKTLIISICLLSIFATGSAQTKRSFSIKGNISGLEDGTAVYLLNRKAKEAKPIDTAYINSGSFKFTGHIPNEIDIYYLRLDSSVSKLAYGPFILVNGPMGISGSLQHLSSLRLEGSTPYIEFLEIQKLNRELLADLKARKIDSTERVKKRAGLFRSFIRSHYQSLFTPSLFDEIFDHTSLIDLKNMYDSLGTAAKAGTFGQKLGNQMEVVNKVLAIKVGEMVPNFSMEMGDGSSATIREIASKGKITLIDFWASSCVPCRNEVPNLKKVYGAYHDKGFNILGLSSDVKREVWKKALAEDKTTWFQALDTSEAYKKLFFISGIPSYIMIDQTGRIVSLSLFSSIVSGGGPSLRGEGLKETVMHQLGL